MTTARYPKDVLLERIDEKIASLADEMSAEQSEELKNARSFVTKTQNSLSTLDVRLAEISQQARLAEATIADPQKTDIERYAEAKKLSGMINTFENGWPSAGYNSWSYEQGLKKIEKKYEVKARFLAGKRKIIESADAPDGFTMTALEKLHLLEAIG